MIRLVELTLIAGIMTAYSLAQAIAVDPLPYTERSSFVVSVNGEVDQESRVFIDSSYKKFLLVSSKMPTALILDIEKFTATTYLNSQISVSDGYEARLKTEKRSTEIRICELEGPHAKCLVNGQLIGVQSRPELVGEIKAEDLYSYSSHYLREQAGYTLNRESVDLIRKVKVQTEIQVYLGTWCKLCQRVLPRFLRIVSNAGNPNLRLHLIGVNKSTTEPAKLLDGMKLSRIPTFVLLRNGKEVHRFVPDEKMRLEDELALALKQSFS